MLNNQKIHIATIGKCVGLHGQLKLHLHTDFIEQFVAGSKFIIDKNEQITIESFHAQKSLVKFENYPDRTSATKLVNKKLFTTVEESKKHCVLKEGEYFWFDMINAKVLEGDLLLGTVKEIERITNTDYLIIQTADVLVDQKLPQKFYIPYIPHYIDHFEQDTKTIYTQGAYDLLEAS